MSKFVHNTHIIDINAIAQLSIAIHF